MRFVSIVSIQDIRGTKQSGPYITLAAAAENSFVIDNYTEDGRPGEV